MISYAARQIFSELAQYIWCDAVDIVARVSTRWGNELRCHELARAAHAALWALNRWRLDEVGATLSVVDGQLWAIEHSWLVYQIPGRCSTTQYAKRFLLDVYCPGRLPQVQLIDDHFSIMRGYEDSGKVRGDVDCSMVAKLTREMQT